MPPQSPPVGGGSHTRGGREGGRGRRGRRD